MAFLNGTTFMTPDQILDSFRRLAAMSAGILFLLEGTLLGLLVFQGKRIFAEKRVPITDK